MQCNAQTKQHRVQAQKCSTDVLQSQPHNAALMVDSAAQGGNSAATISYNITRLVQIVQHDKAENASEQHASSADAVLRLYPCSPVR